MLGERQVLFVVLLFIFRKIYINVFVNVYFDSS